MLQRSIIRKDFWWRNFQALQILGWERKRLSHHRFLVLKKHILQFIWPSSNSVYNSHNPKGIELRLGLSHLREHKFKYSFQESVNPLCNCFYEVKRSTVFSTLRNLDSKLFDNTNSLLTKMLLFRKGSLITNQNTAILNTKCVIFFIN